MLNLAEYRRRPALLADHLPWAALVAPGILLNKDGSFQRSYRFRGPDLESATEAELVAACARLNNALRRFGSGWALFFEAERLPAPGYPRSAFPDAAAWLVDEERRAAFAQAAGAPRHLETQSHITLVWLPPVDEVGRLTRLMLDRPRGNGARPWREQLAYFVRETDRIFDLLQPVMAELDALDDGQTLAYLHAHISNRRHPIAVPDPPVYLDGLLVDTPFCGGFEPMLGKQHLRSLTLLGFPDLTRPGLLDELNQLAFPYRWMTRFIPLDKADAERALKRLRRQWFAKRKSMLAILREVLYQQPAPLLDPDADNKTLDADQALQELGGDHVAFGYLTITVVVGDDDPAAAGDKLRALEKVVNSAGFATIRESVNAVEAWLGSLPGHLYANIRQPLVHSLNLAHLVPLAGIWAGPERNQHLDGPPLLLARTRGATPFRLSTHIGDVGHVAVIGPTGAGKSVLLSFMALQFRRYRGARIAIFDKGGSARAAVLAMGGRYYRLGQERLPPALPGRGSADAEQAGAYAGMPALQPLRGIDDPAERSWAAGWIEGLLAQENVIVTPPLKEAVWSALVALSTAPAAQRTLTGLAALLQSNLLKAALLPYTLDGALGALLDADAEDLQLAAVTCFEMEALLQHHRAVLPVLTYLFHRLERSFDGRPVLLILDEAWLYLDHPVFAARIRDWLKTMRKKNVAIVFATQSLSDIAQSSIAATIIESCPQRIFLPNDRAIEPQQYEIYSRFGLNARQIAQLSTAIPKRDYYLQSRQGCRLFELGLGPIALSLCAKATPADHRRMDAVLAEHGADGFLAAWLHAMDLAWAADLARGFAAAGSPVAPAAQAATGQMPAAAARAQDRRAQDRGMQDRAGRDRMAAGHQGGIAAKPRPLPAQEEPQQRAQRSRQRSPARQPRPQRQGVREERS